MNHRELRGGELTAHTVTSKRSNFRRIGKTGPRGDVGAGRSSSALCVIAVIDKSLPAGTSSRCPRPFMPEGHLRSLLPLDPFSPQGQDYRPLSTG
jgi:hypothetical protein